MLTVSVIPRRLTSTTVPEVLTRPLRPSVRDAGTGGGVLDAVREQVAIAAALAHGGPPNGADVLKFKTTSWPVAIAFERWRWTVCTRFSAEPRSDWVCEYRRYPGTRSQ
jgi:hypothetical protein